MAEQIIEEKELTRIERELVLQYLRDDNVPVTVTLEQKPKALDSEIEEGKTTLIPNDSRIPASAMFPVAIPSQQLQVLNQGIILLKNVERSVQPFLGKKVRVQFYFNHVGLYFISEMKEYSQGLALVIPSVIKRVQETAYKPNYSLSGKISYEASGSTVTFDCFPLAGYNLFIQPKWDDIEIECQKDAKYLLEQIVAEARSGMSASIGNGLQLFPVVKFLTDKALYASDAVSGKVKPFNLIYIDEKKMVLSSFQKETKLELEEEYDVCLTFNLAANSMLKRTVNIKVLVENIYSDSVDGEKSCFVCSYRSIQQEDIRFLYEKIFVRR